MKGLFKRLAVVFTCITSCFFVGCKGVDDDVTPTAYDDAVKIQITATVTDLTDTTLEEYMTAMRQDGLIEYTIEYGMVSSINGRANADGKYWMIYTSDEENSNPDYCIEYGFARYYSALYGAETLKVKEGDVYVWAYHGF